METKEPKIVNRVSLPGLMRGHNEDNDTFEFVISNETPDRHGTVIKLDGWNFDNYRKNPIVLYQHQSGKGFLTDANPDNVIGKAEIFIEGGDVIARVSLEPESINKQAANIKAKLEFGSLRATSVGFAPSEGHWGDSERGEDPNLFYFTEHELLELSIVDIPSNPDAVKRGLDEVIKGLKKPIVKDKKEIENNKNKGALHLKKARLLINKNKAK